MTTLLHIAVMIGLLAIASSPVWPQDSPEALRLYNEAVGIYSKAQSKSDTQRAAQLFEQALKSYRKTGDSKGEAECLNKIGEIYDDWAEYDQALDYYERSLAIWRQRGDLQGEGLALNNIGLVHYNRGDYAKALDYWKKCLEIRTKIGHAAGEAVTLNNIAGACERLGKYPEALERYQEALKIQRGLKDEKGEAITLNNIGEVYRSTGDYPQALKNYHESLKIKRKLGDAAGEAPTLNNIGLVHEARGEYREALDHYEKTLLIFQKIGDTRGESTSWNNIGSTHQKVGQYSKSLQCYEKYLGTARRLGDTQSESVALNNIASVYDAKGQYQEALAFYQQSMILKHKIGDVKGEAAVLNNMGRVCDTKGDYDEAVDHYSKSIAISERIGDVQGQGVTLNNMGSVYKAWCRYPKALEFYQQSLSITKRIGDAKQEAMTLNNIAAVYDDWWQYQKAMDYYDQSLAIKRRIGDAAGEAATLNNIGEVNRSWGYYSKALDLYEKALEMHRQIGDRSGEAIVLNNIGLLYAAWGKYPEALDYYSKSLTVSESLGEPAVQGNTHNNIAMVYEAWGWYPQALEHFQNSLQKKQSRGDVQGVGVVMHNMAHVNMAMGRHDEALAHLEKALEICTRLQIPSEGIKASLGEVYIDLGNVAKAEPYLREAGYDSSMGLLALNKADFTAAQKHYQSLMAYAETNRNAVSLFTAYTGLGVVYESRREYSKSEECYRKAVEQVEEMRAAIGPLERENFFSVKTNGFRRTDPYEGRARVLAKMGRFVEALKQSEYTKARLFSEALSRRTEAAQIPVEKAVLDKELRINERIAALTKKIQQATEKGDSAAVSFLASELSEEKSKKASYINALREEYPLYAATKYPLPMDLSRAAVKDDEWIIEYDVTEEGLLIYLLRGRTLVNGLFKSVHARELEQLTCAVRAPMEIVLGTDSVEDKLRSFDFTASRRLADVLFGDVLAKIPKGAPVVVIPDGFLGVVPFEMLVLNEGGAIAQRANFPLIVSADFLGERNPISYYQSITALSLARTLGTQRKPQEKLLVMADPVFEMRDARAQQETVPARLAGVEARLYEDLMTSVEEGQGGYFRFGRLPQTGELANDLHSSFKGSCSVYTGLRATKEALLKDISPRLEEYGKVVFATHGYVGRGLPGINEPVLVFSLVPPGTDGYLRMSEVMGMRMNADLVALTACQTGIGKDLSGEGVMGMGRAFQFAGAKSVLTSLWSVSEQSSVMLVEQLFKRLKDGKGKLEALKEAREHIRSQGYDHPFFWASFILVGEAN